MVYGNGMTADRLRLAAELRGLAERRAYAAGWIRRAFAELTGAALPDPLPPAAMPSAATVRWCRARGARWAKQRQREGAR